MNLLRSLFVCLITLGALTGCQNLQTASTTAQQYVKPSTVSLATQLLVSKQLTGAKTVTSYDKKSAQWKDIAGYIVDINVNGVSFEIAKAKIMKHFEADPEKALLITVALDLVPANLQAASTGSVNDPYLTAISDGIGTALRLSIPPEPAK